MDKPKSVPNKSPPAQSHSGRTRLFGSKAKKVLFLNKEWRQVSSCSRVHPCSPGQVVGMKQDLPIPHPGGDSFLVVPYLKTRIAEQSREEAEPCSERKKNHICLILKVKETLLLRKLLRDQKVNDGKSTYPQASSGEFILAERCACTPGRILRYTKYGLRTRQIKMLDQRKPRRNAP